MKGLTAIGMCLAVLLLSVTSFAKFLPDNNLYLYDGILAFDGAPTMTQAQFDSTIDKVVAKMEPSFKLHGAQVQIAKDWVTSEVNAYSSQESNVWTVHLFGGLARRPEVSVDGFSIVICHEFGHHLGGFPFYSDMGDWAASEGEADYFATEVCARKIWAADTAINASFRGKIPADVAAKCNAAWPGVADQNLCYRAVSASAELGNLLSFLMREKITYQSPDQTLVPQTLQTYPATGQCRLDTYLAGMLCKANFNLSVIPGRTTTGDQASFAAEKVAAANSCTKTSGYTVGLRPRCWYLPRL
jgi:hypothetical protein